MATGRRGPPAPWLASILMALALWGLTGGFPRLALAEVIVGVPAGWLADNHASGEARDRAERLAARVDMRLTTVMSTASRDEFSETLAVLESPTPLAPADLADEDAARLLLTRSARPITGTEAPPDTFGRRIVADTAVVHGSWRVRDLSYRVALAPWGPNHSMVVLVTRGAEESLYRPLFAEIIEGLDGVLAPVTPFPVEDWRAGALVGWVLLAFLVYIVVAVSAERSGDHVLNGRRSAFAVLMLAVVAGGVVYVVLGGQLMELRVAEISRERVVSEVAGLGGAVALVVLLVTSWIPRPRMIASAPGAGAFASRTATFKAGGGLYDSSGVDLVKVDSSESPANLVPEPAQPRRASTDELEPMTPEDVEAQVDAAVDALVVSSSPDDEPEVASAPPPEERQGRRGPPRSVPGQTRMPAPGVVELEDAPEEILEVDAILEEVEVTAEGAGRRQKVADEAETVVRRAPAPQRIDDERDTKRRDLDGLPDDDMATVARPAPSRQSGPGPWRKRPISEYSVRTIKPGGPGRKKR